MAHANLVRSRALAAHRFLVALVAAAPMATIGCQKSEKPAPKKEMAEKAEPPEKAAAPASPSDSECIGAFETTGEAKTMTIAEQTYELRGAHLKQTSTDADAKAVLGVMANIKEDTPENLANIKAILSFFKTEGVEAIVIAGDLGESESQIVNVLKPIAEAGVPVLIVIGNREPKADFNKAAAAVAKDHPGVVNLNFVRLVSLDDVSLVSVPGYYNKSYIHAQGGCHYQTDDLAIVEKAAKAAGDKPVVLVSHGGPKQDGPDGIDRTLEQANVGNPALAKTMAAAGIKLGIFANIHEAGGKATDPTGKTLIKQNEMVDTMYLNPGATDAVSWPMNDETRSVGMAAVMTIDGGKASYKVHRIPEAG